MTSDLMVWTQKDTQTTLAVDRIIGRVSSGVPGPTVVFFGGIHGNEPAGVRALEKVFAHFESGEVPCERGTIIGIRGNLPALGRQERYLQHDLNRLWNPARIERILATPESQRSAEEQELASLHGLLMGILEEEAAPFYFIDLHTTSSQTLPFITINDSMINRKFSELFPVPVILGIEEYLEGPLLSYINQLGYMALGFESGQHQDPAAVTHAEDFIWLTLYFSGATPSFAGYRQSYRRLQQAALCDHYFYEVFYRHELSNGHGFKMEEGYRSFQRVPRGTRVATQQGEPLELQKPGILFMPLYQQQGEEGFFLIRQTPRWALGLSARMRKWNFHRALSVLPGVKWADDRQDRLVVDLRVARFMSKPFFHLLGYRSRQRDATHLVLQNREHRARNRDYADTPWFSRN
jgi:hypothetical protein